MTVHIYQTTRRHIQKYRNINAHLPNYTASHPRIPLILVHIYKTARSYVQESHNPDAYLQVFSPVKRNLHTYIPNYTASYTQKP
jgi:hypothetical protein